MKKALIADVKSLTVHDGPGLRTTLFLKGCPLACRWCHNPECIRFQPELLYRDQRCTDCGRCCKPCPNGAHAIEPGAGHVFNRDLCHACGQCVGACFSGALELCGQEATPEEMAKILLVDADFYRHSGGGVTLSGGEPLTQADFCGALLTILKSQGIHTAIDTCGAVPWQAFATVLPATDLFLYDIKHIDPEEHARLTGMSNELILENLMRLSETGKSIEIRMPLIPGMNMALEAIAATGRFLSALPQKPLVRLLAYHPYALDKYRSIGRNPVLSEISAPEVGDLDKIEAELKSHGLRLAGVDRGSSPQAVHRHTDQRSNTAPDRDFPEIPQSH